LNELRPNLLRWVALACATLMLSMTLAPTADAGRRNKGKKWSPPGLVQQALQQAQTDEAGAITTLENFVVERPSSSVTPWAALYAGELHRLTVSVQSPDAERHFVWVLDRFAGHLLQGAASLGLALNRAGESPVGQDLATLEWTPESTAPRSMNADRYRVLAMHHEQGGKDDLARATAKKAAEYAIGQISLEQRVRQTVGHLLSNDLKNRLTPPPADARSPDRIRLDEGQARLLADDFAGTKAILETILKKWPDSEHLEEVHATLARAESGDPIAERVVGVLLPLSGRLAPAGKRLEQIIRLTNASLDRPLDLLFRDTAGDPSETRKVLDSLVLEDGAMAVVGPLVKETAFAAAERAQALRVPLIAFTQTPGITEGKDYVFRGGITHAQQIRALVDHVIGLRNIRTFAILAPDTPYGHGVAESFIAEVTTREAEVKHALFYDPAVNDYTEIARTLGQKDYEARAKEFKDMQEAAEERGADVDKMVLPPLVDFEALFIPDSARKLPVVASALAWEEFSLGSFIARKDDQPLLVLGLNSWHDERLVIDGGEYLRNGLFVDAYDPRSTSELNQAFMAHVEANLERSPSLFDALGHDVTRILASAFEAEPTDRASLRDALLAADFTGAVAGGGKFGTQREVQRDFVVFTILKDGIQPAEYIPEADEATEEIDAVGDDQTPKE